MSGGSDLKSVEVFVPSSGKHCLLPGFPESYRGAHTMEGMTVCGGGGHNNASTSCISLKLGGWKVSATLQEER